MADFRKMKAQAKKRRAKSLLAQALLAVLAVALVFGNAYCVVKLVHGEAVFTLPSVRRAFCAGQRRLGAGPAGGVWQRAKCGLGQRGLRLWQRGPAGGQPHLEHDSQG